MLDRMISRGFVTQTKQPVSPHTLSIMVIVELISNWSRVISLMDLLFVVIFTDQQVSGLCMLHEIKQAADWQCSTCHSVRWWGINHQPCWHLAACRWSRTSRWSGQIHDRSWVGADTGQTTRGYIPIHTFHDKQRKIQDNTNIQIVSYTSKNPVVLCLPFSSPELIWQFFTETGWIRDQEKKGNDNYSCVFFFKEGSCPSMMCSLEDFLCLFSDTASSFSESNESLPHFTAHTSKLICCNILEFRYDINF